MAPHSVILTYIWNFEDAENAAEIAQLDHAVTQYGGRMVFAELQAPLDVRLQRNTLASRRARKNVSWATDDYLRAWDRAHCTESAGAFPYPDRHVLIDTTALPPDEAAARICERFAP